MSQKKDYTKPRLIVHGSVEEMTRGSLDGEFLDADFPAGTPKKDLGFS